MSTAPQNPARKPAFGLRSLAGHTAVYGFGSALTALGGFILLPLYTHSFAPAQYGLLELLNRVADVLLLFVFMGTRQAYIRFYFDDDTDRWRRTVTATTLVFALGSAAVLVPFAILLSTLAPAEIWGSEHSSRIVLLIGLWIPAEVVFTVALAYLQVSLRSLAYVALNALRLAGFVGLNVYLIHGRDFGVDGVFLSQLIVVASIALAFLVYLVRWTGFAVSVDLLKRLVKFGAPYIPAALLWYLAANADRFFLTAFQSMNDLGIYSLGLKLGSVALALFMQPFQKVWSPFVFSVYKEANGPQKIGQAFTAFTAFGAYLILGICVLAPIVLPYLSDRAYFSATLVIPIVGTAQLLYGMACLIDAGLLIEKKTQYKPLIFGLTALVAVLANAVLTPLYSIVGAACATCISFGFLYLINKHYSDRFYRVALESKDFLAIIAAAGIAYWSFETVYVNDAPLPKQLLMAVVPALVYPAMLMILRPRVTKRGYAYLRDRRAATPPETR